MKIGIIARCKNEIKNLESWINNKNFCDLFLITDNDSTDGSYEFLSKQTNVIVTKVVGFDEGRDFQILLKQARSHKIDWVFKFDCDEFVDQNFETQLDHIVTNTNYDCILMRKIAKHYTMPDRKCFVGGEYFNGLVYGVRLTSKINIKDRIIHVGSFRFYRNPVIVESLVSHFWIQSKEDAVQRAQIYSQVDKTKKYEIKDKISFENLKDIEAASSQKLKKYNSYAIPFLYKKNFTFAVIKPKFTTSLAKLALKKNLIWPILYWVEKLIYRQKKY